MPEAFDDPGLGEFFGSVLKKKSDRTILDLVLQNLDREAILESLLQQMEAENSPKTEKRGKRQ